MSKETNQGTLASLSFHNFQNLLIAILKDTNAYNFIHDSKQSITAVIQIHFREIEPFRFPRVDAKSAEILKSISRTLLEVYKYYKV